MQRFSKLPLLFVLLFSVAVAASVQEPNPNFNWELDQEAPDHPLLIAGGRRAKVSGSTSWARRTQSRQRASQDRQPSPDPRIDELLVTLADKENATPKPWRQPTGNGAVRPAAPNGRAS